MCLLDAALDALGLAHIEFQRQRMDAEVLDLLLELAQPLALAARDHQVGPRPRQCPGHVLPEPAARARDDGHLTRQVERIPTHELASSAVLQGLAWERIVGGAC